MSLTAPFLEGADAPAAYPSSVADYVRREKRTGTWLSIGFFAFVFAGGLLALPVLVWVSLYGRSTRRGWVEFMRAEAGGASVPLDAEERRVVRRAVGRRRVVWIVLLGLMALLGLLVLGAVATLASDLSRGGGVGVLLVVVVLLAAMVGGAAWWAARGLREAAQLIGRLDGPGEVLGMRLRGPFVGRQIMAPPRFGGLPLMVLDPKWHTALQAVDGGEVELVLAPTFADDPKPTTPRVPVRLPAGVA